MSARCRRTIHHLTCSVPVFVPWHSYMCVQTSWSARRSSSMSTSSKRDDVLRSTKISKHSAAKNKATTPLSDAIVTLPNILTASRIVMAPILMHLIVKERFDLALDGFLIAGLTDLADGYIARSCSSSSVLGSFLDPLADKLLIGTVTAALAYKGLMSPFLVALVIGRDVGLVVGAAIHRAVSMPKGWNWFEYFSLINFSKSSREMRPSNISKFNTVLQLGWILASLVTHAFVLEHGVMMLPYIGYGVAVTTTWSGIDYMFTSRYTVKKCTRNITKTTPRKHTQ